MIDTPLVVATNYQVILGLGMATLLSTNNTPHIMLVTATEGVRISGILFDASALFFSINGDAEVGKCDVYEQYS
jgi:hypothetical protein